MKKKLQAMEQRFDNLIDDQRIEEFVDSVYLTDDKIVRSRAIAIIKLNIAYNQLQKAISLTSDTNISPDAIEYFLRATEYMRDAKSQVVTGMEQEQTSGIHSKDNASTISLSNFDNKYADILDAAGITTDHLDASRSNRAIVMDRIDTSFENTVAKSLVNAYVNLIKLELTQATDEVKTEIGQLNGIIKGLKNGEIKLTEKIDLLKDIFSSEQELSNLPKLLEDISRMQDFIKGQIPILERVLGKLNVVGDNIQKASEELSAKVNGLINQQIDKVSGYIISIISDNSRASIAQIESIEADPDSSLSSEEINTIDTINREMDSLAQLAAFFDRQTGTSDYSAKTEKLITDINSRIAKMSQQFISGSVSEIRDMVYENQENSIQLIVEQLTPAIKAGSPESKTIDSYFHELMDKVEILQNLLARLPGEKLLSEELKKQLLSQLKIKTNEDRKILDRLINRAVADAVVKGHKLLNQIADQLIDQKNNPDTPEAERAEYSDHIDKSRHFILDVMADFSGVKIAQTRANKTGHKQFKDSIKNIKDKLVGGDNPGKKRVALLALLALLALVIEESVLRRSEKDSLLQMIEALLNQGKAFKEYKDRIDEQALTNNEKNDPNSIPGNDRSEKVAGIQQRIKNIEDIVDEADQRDQTDDIISDEESADLSDYAAQKQSELAETAAELIADHYEKKIQNSPNDIDPNEDIEKIINDSRIIDELESSIRDLDEHERLSEENASGKNIVDVTDEKQRLREAALQAISNTAARILRETGDPQKVRDYLNDLENRLREKGYLSDDQELEDELPPANDGRKVEEMLAASEQEILDSAIANVLEVFNEAVAEMSGDPIDIEVNGEQRKLNKADNDEQSAKLRQASNQITEIVTETARLLPDNDEEQLDGIGDNLISALEALSDIADPGLASYNNSLNRIRNLYNNYVPTGNAVKVKNDIIRINNQVEQVMEDTNKQLNNLNSAYRISSRNYETPKIRFMDRCSTYLFDMASQEFESILVQLEDEYYTEFSGMKVSRNDRNRYMERAAQLLKEIFDKYNEITEETLIEEIKGTIEGKKVDLNDEYGFWMDEREVSFPESVSG